MFNKYFVDLHIHVGITKDGSWIKIPTSKTLTVEKILNETVYKKGLDIIGIVDAISPKVLFDLEEMIASNLLIQDKDGGYHYKNKTTLILGAEIETTEKKGLAHTLIYLPTIEEMREFSKIMASHIKNINLSSQNSHMSLKSLIDIAKDFNSLIIPAHIFTPHKSFYGACCNRFSDLLPEEYLNKISAVELGLSSDSFLADRINELSGYSFVTNSDAHSLDKIGREYNVFSLKNPNFKEIALALANKENRKIMANYGLNPRLGKYHRTRCQLCDKLIPPDTNSTNCPFCSSKKIVKGVLDRINEIADFENTKHPQNRPDYFYQVPLEFIPGLGKKTYNKLLDKFENEINILNFVPYENLADIAGEKVATYIISSREGTSKIQDGGGGTYGKII
ncbi:endonuclease Q family protein [Selenomonadales bacterium OttesenSCG-928-I06]|nr:endonuclease Q family protein [Selenomonadales bacterium OttesenSCG-928-I06]